MHRRGSVHASGGVALAKRRAVANGTPLNTRKPFCSAPMIGPLVVETYSVELLEGAKGDVLDRSPPPEAQ